MQFKMQNVVGVVEFRNIKKQERSLTKHNNTVTQNRSIKKVHGNLAFFSQISSFHRLRSIPVQIKSYRSAYQTEKISDLRFLISIYEPTIVFFTHFFLPHLIFLHPSSHATCHVIFPTLQNKMSIVIPTFSFTKAIVSSILTPIHPYRESRVLLWHDSNL